MSKYLQFNIATKPVSKRLVKESESSGDRSAKYGSQ
jgi:hypothetical protein